MNIAAGDYVILPTDPAQFDRNAREYERVAVTTWETWETRVTAAKAAMWHRWMAEQARRVIE